jgi:hypothetical protein
MTTSIVIPNLIWNPANIGRGSVLDEVKLPFGRDAIASVACWIPNRVWNDGEVTGSLNHG